MYPKEVTVATRPKPKESNEKAFQFDTMDNQDQLSYEILDGCYIADDDSDYEPLMMAKRSHKQAQVPKKSKRIRIQDLVDNMDIDSPLLVCLYLLFITLLSVHSYNQL
jgi:hypothetical protein